VIKVVRSATDFAVPLHQVRSSIASPKRGRRSLRTVVRRTIQAISRDMPASIASASATSCSQRPIEWRWAIPSPSTSIPSTTRRWV
jgi:hypothetical protein